MVWDYGTYRNLRDRPDRPFSMERSLREGKVEVELAGKKLKGSWVLVRTAFGPKGLGWMLKKMKGEKAIGEEPVLAHPNSAKTGRKMEQIAARGRS